MNTDKTILSTVISNIKLGLVLGDTVDTLSLDTLLILRNIKNYLLEKNSNGIDVSSILNRIENLIINLERTCKNICNKNTKILQETIVKNTPPIISNKNLNICYDLVDEIVNISDIVENFKDYENNNYNYIRFSNIEDNLIIKKDENLIQENLEYQNSDTFNINISLDYTTDNNLNYYLEETFDINNNCTNKLFTINKDIVQNAIDNDFVFDKVENGYLYLKKEVTISSSLPLNTIIYVHIDTTYFLSNDRLTIKNKILNWYNNFIFNNPGVNPELIINTVPNSEISNNYHPQGSSNGKAIITDTNIDYFNNINTENWLQNPLEGLLRQAYKEGITTFTLVEFQQYILNKKIITLSFVNETHPNYHGDENYTSFIDTDIGDTSQPSIKYINHYNSFMNDLLPNLNYFKGVLYPITEPFDKFNDNFLLHIMGALESNVITQSQVNDYLGTSKVAIYNSSMQNKFYDNICIYNPYIGYPNLKNAGWSGILNKSLPISTVINNVMFDEEINNIFTSGDIENYTSNEYLTFEMEELQITSSFYIEVKDDYTSIPLWSNKAKITVDWCFSCNLQNFPI